MKFIGPIIDWLGQKSPPSDLEMDRRYLLLEQGQQSKRAEQYEDALAKFAEARQLAEDRGDHTALVVISLHHAETLIALQRWDEAEHMLLHLRRQAQTDGEHNHLTYVLVTLGTLEEGRGNRDEARSYYEQARSVAQKSSSLGGEGRALGHLAGIYLQEDNASYAVHLLREALPKLNMSGDIELSTYFIGQFGRALILSGQEAEGERLLYRALRLAEQLHYRRYERLWALTLARRALSGLRYDEALKLYQQALALFDTANDDVNKIETLCETSRIYLYQTDYELALDHAQRAMDSAQQNGSELLQAIARGTYGMVLHAQGRSDDAMAYLAQAVSSVPIDTPLQIEIMRSLAGAQARTGAVGHAIKTYESVLKITADTPLEQAQTHLELGILYEQQRDLQQAIEQWKAALTLFEGERYYAQAARLYCDIGGARRWLGQGKRALKEYDQALMMLSSVDDLATRGVVVSNAAIAYADLGDVESAEAFFKESIRIAQQLEDDSAEATRLGNYGWFLLSIGRGAVAVRQLEQSLKLSQRLGLDLQVAVQTDNLGLGYDVMGDTARALTYHQQALELIDTLDNAHWQNMIQINLASTLLHTGEDEEALALFTQCLNQGREISDVEVIARALMGQARVALKRDQPQAVDDLLQEAIHLTRQSDLRRLLAEALQLHSEQQAALNQSSRSLELWDEAQKLFSILQMPEARQEPDWLDEAQAEPEN